MCAETPIRATSPVDVLAQQTARRPDHEFLEIGRVTYSYAEFHLQTDRYGRFFEEQGITQGDKVALMLPNIDVFVLAWLGVARIGGVTVPINVHLRGELLEYILRHSDAKLLVIDRNLHAIVEEVRQRIPELRIFQAGDGASPGSEVVIEALLPPRGGSPATCYHPQPDHPMSILYTSGTTGPSKGVMIPHYSYLVTAARYLENVRATESDRLFTCLPLFHVNAQQTSFMAALASGIKVTIEDRFSVSNFWEQIRRSQATVANYIGTMLTLLSKAPPSEDDRKHRLRVLWGAPAPKEIMREFEQRFGVKLIEVFGLTETGTFCLANPYDKTKVGSCGLPLQHTEAKIVDDHDRELGPGATGEIVARSKIENAFMTGYYKMPQKTEEAMRGGWFHTGDLGRRDEEGYFYYMDRMKDCIRRRGENISSFEVEKGINSHPAVRESAVIGVPSELGEEDIAAFIILRPGATTDPEDIVRWCERRMAYFMVPRYVVFREEFPKTATGRVQKYQLKQEDREKMWDRQQAGRVIRRQTPL